MSIEKVHNWQDAKQFLRTYRDENIRKSKDVLDLWEKYVAQFIQKFADEKWVVYEQVFIAALDCNNLQVANECLNALKTKFPKSERVKKLVGMKFEAMQQYGRAIDIYNKMLENDELNSLVRKRLIACLKAQNSVTEYIDELNEYLKIYQTDHEAWLELCEAYLNELDYSRAAFCLEELILMFPHNHVYNQRYADIKYTQGNFDIARTYYSYALKLNPNNVRALYGLLLSASNLKSSSKSKEAVGENAKLADWASEELLAKYKVNTSALVDNINETLCPMFAYFKGKKSIDNSAIDGVSYLLKNVSLK